VGEDVLPLLSSRSPELGQGKQELQSDHAQEVLPVSLLPVPGKGGLVSLGSEEDGVEVSRLADGLDVVFPVCTELTAKMVPFRASWS